MAIENRSLLMHKHQQRECLALNVQSFINYFKPLRKSSTIAQQAATLH